MFAAFQGIAPLSALQPTPPTPPPSSGTAWAGRPGDRVISLAVVLSVLATTQVAIIGTSRLLYSMSRDRVLPARLGKISERYQTPAFSTIALGGLDDRARRRRHLRQLGRPPRSATWSRSADSSTRSSTRSPGCPPAGSTARCLTRSVKDALLLGVLPLAGAGLLLWVAVQGGHGLTAPRSGHPPRRSPPSASRLLLVAVKVYKSPIFKIKSEAASTTEATPTSAPTDVASGRIDLMQPSTDRWRSSPVPPRASGSASPKS